MTVVTICSDSEAQENKISHHFGFFPFYLPWSDGAGRHDLNFLNVELPAFSLFSFTLMKRLFSSSLLSAIKVISSAYLRLLILPSNLDSSLWFIFFQYEKAKKYESHHCVQLCIGPYNLQLVFSSSFITQQQQKYREYIHF